MTATQSDEAAQALQPLQDEGIAATSRRAAPAQYKRVGVVVAIAIAVTAAYFAGVFDVFADEAQVREALDRWGAWAYALYVVTFTLIEPFAVPAFVFVLAAAAVWPAWIAFALSLVASLCASLLGFVLARYVARDWVAARLPARFSRFDERLSRRGVITVTSIRLVFFLAPPSHWVLGLSRVSTASYVVGTLAGALPWLITLTFVGGGVVDWLRSL